MSAPLRDLGEFTESWVLLHWLLSALKMWKTKGSRWYERESLHSLAPSRFPCTTEANIDWHFTLRCSDTQLVLARGRKTRRRTNQDSLETLTRQPSLSLSPVTPFIWSLLIGLKQNECWKTKIWGRCCSGVDGPVGLAAAARDCVVLMLLFLSPPQLSLPAALLASCSPSSSSSSWSTAWGRRTRAATTSERENPPVQPIKRPRPRSFTRKRPPLSPEQHTASVSWRQWSTTTAHTQRNELNMEN